MLCYLIDRGLLVMQRRLVGGLLLWRVVLI